MKRRDIGIFLAVWSAVFACVHVAWAAGWRGGIPPQMAPIGDRPWFLAYDVAAALLMYVASGAALILALGRSGSRLRRLTVAASTAALLRGVPAAGLDGAAGDFGAMTLGVDLWFTVAGAAGLALWFLDRPGATKRPERETASSVGTLMRQS